MTARGFVRPGELVVVSKEAHEAVADYLEAEIVQYLGAVQVFRDEGCDIIPNLSPVPSVAARPRRWNPAWSIPV